MLTKEQLHEKIANGLRFLDGATGSNLRKAGMPLKKGPPSPAKTAPAQGLTTRPQSRRRTPPSKDLPKALCRRALNGFLSEKGVWGETLSFF